MSSIKVSFILPCYNTGRYLTQCVESLIDQGLRNDEFEIICVNNAATDNTAELLAELSKKYSVVKVVTLLVNQCSGGAYNAGLDVAQGKYVQFVDSDDYLKTGSILPLYELMERESLEMLFFNIESFKGNGELTHIDNLRFNGNIQKEINVSTGDEFLSTFLSYHMIDTIPVPAYRKMILKSKLIESGIRFSHTTIGTDFVHNIELLTKFNRIAAICNKIYMFRYNPDGVTKSKMTTSKIVYALNNYSKAFVVVNQSKWNESNKTIIKQELGDTINRYLLYIRNVESEDVAIVFRQLNNLPALHSVAKGVMTNLFLNHPKLYAKFIGLKYPLLTKMAYKFLN